VTVGIALALAGCGSKLPVRTLDVDDHAVSAEIAADEETRMRGLMYRDAMGEDDGMLFVYPDERVRSFWMKDTRIPLSIAFADKHGTIVWIADMKPFDTRSTSSMVPATYALEMNQGWFARNGVERGDSIGNLPTDGAK
jgi:uncharacterized membrane protein (UPF0127 family)